MLLNKNKTLSNTKILNTAPYIVICAVVWEFFSYFGMRALLVLYLTQALSFSDDKAYAIYGAFTSLIFVSPIIGGFVADRYIGYRFSILIGSVLIMLGHFTLMFSNAGFLYPGLSLLICGIGFFKSSALCLIGECASDNAAKRNSLFTLYYVGGNVGATIAPIVCGFVAAKFSWEIGFASAGIGMSIGLATLLYFKRYFKTLGQAPITFKTKQGKWRLDMTISLAVFMVLFLLSVNFLLYKLYVSYLLIAFVFISIAILINIMKNTQADKRASLSLAMILTLVGTLFWIFDQQGGNSLSLFILRYVQRTLNFSISGFSINTLIPAPMFQSVSTFAIIFFGLAYAVFFKWLSKKNKQVGSITQVGMGVLILTLGFTMITKGANLAALNGTTPMSWIVFGLSLIGMAELFIDPVILALISKASPKKYMGMMNALYYLYVGAIANYLSAMLAKLTAPTKTALTQTPQILLFKNTYTDVVYTGCGLLIFLGILWVFKKKWS